MFVFSCMLILCHPTYPHLLKCMLITKVYRELSNLETKCCFVMLFLYFPTAASKSSRKAKKSKVCMHRIIIFTFHVVLIIIIFVYLLKLLYNYSLRIALWVKNVFWILSWSGLKGSLSGFWTGVKVTTAADMSNEMQNIMLVVKSLTHHDIKTLALKSKTLWQVNYDFGAEKLHHWCFRDFKI